MNINSPVSAPERSYRLAKHLKGFNSSRATKSRMSPPNTNQFLINNNNDINSEEDIIPCGSVLMDPFDYKFNFNCNDFSCVSTFDDDL